VKDFKMYIPVRDETNYMIKYYQYLFNKYWGDHVKVYFLGYKKPDIKLEKNINFISLAEQRAPEAHAWSAPIVDFFESIDDEYFYFSVEDLLIIRPVDLELLKTCRKIMSPKIGRIDLWNSCQFDPGRRGWVEYYKEVEGVEFLIQSQNPPPSVYRISCSNSIWNRKWFLKTLERGWSPGDWETKANDGRNNNDGFDVLSTIDRWTPTVVHSLCKHWRGKINLYGMLEHDREKIYDMSNEEEKGMLCDITTAVTAVNIDYMDPIRRKKKNIMDMECFQPNSKDISNIRYKK